jgi:hypothetical protein
MYTQTNVFFKILATSPRPIVSFFSLDQGKALPKDTVIVGLPDGFLAVDHPEGLEDNAWTVGGPLPDYLAIAALRKAGFQDETAISVLMKQLGLSYDPALGSRSGHLTGITIHPQGYAIVSTNHMPRHRPAPEERLDSFEAVRFRVDQREEWRRDGTSEIAVRVRLDVFENNEWHFGPDCNGFADLPGFLFEEGSQYYRSTLSKADTEAALRALGYQEDPSLFLWYNPEDLLFYVGREDESDPTSDPYVFIMPKDVTPWTIQDTHGSYNPYEDDLRGDSLGVEPFFLDGDTMENTFAIKPGFSLETVREAMIAAGYTYDESLRPY